MGACGAAHSAGQARWKPASCRGARSDQRPDVYSEYRLPVARDSQDLPPRTTLYDYLDRWIRDGTLDRMHDALYVQCREAASREASPTAAIIDSQSVKSAEKGACDRSVGLRRWQEDQGQEAACPGRYAGPADACHRSCRGRPGPRRRHAGDGELVRGVPVPGETLRRWRLPGARVPPRYQARSWGESTSRSSYDPVKPQASLRSQSVGSWNALSLGSAAAADSPRTGNASTARRAPSSASLQSV